MISTLISGPDSEPVSLAEAKTYCRIDHDDEDALVSLLISAARIEVEALADQTMVARTWRLTLDHPPLLVRLPHVPVLKLVAAPDGATLLGDAVRLAQADESVTIDYIAGYGEASAVPADLRQAVLMLVAFWYDNRDLAASPPVTVARMLSPYRRVRL